MNFNGIINKIGFQIQKHSPEILLIGGLIGVGVGTIFACKATTKANGIIAKTKREIDDIHAIADNEEIASANNYTENDKRKDLTIVYTKTALDFIKLYGPSILIMSTSIMSILASYGIMHKRNIALSTAFAALNQEFKTYRKRLIEKFDENLDRELKYGLTSKKVETTVIDDNGKEVKKKETLEFIDYDGIKHSQFAKFFDSTSREFMKNPEYNLGFLKARESEANMRLKANGFLFLNDVYDMLDIQRTIIGQTVGWVYDEKNPIGDNYVDFGIYQANYEPNRRFVNGYEPVILLDFNVDGDILNRVKLANT